MWLVEVGGIYGVVSRRWVWVESKGVASGCGCKEVQYAPKKLPLPFKNISLSVHNPFVFSVRFEPVLIYFHVA